MAIEGAHTSQKLVVVAQVDEDLAVVTRGLEQNAQRARRELALLGRGLFRISCRGGGR